jgi:hypothetical protein
MLSFEFLKYVNGNLFQRHPEPACGKAGLFQDLIRLELHIKLALK